MKHFRSICLAAIVAAGTAVCAQGVLPVDHIVVNDPRIFDMSDDGSGYALEDGPLASGQLSVIHGPKGALVGSIVIQDDQLNMWGPISVAGKLGVKGTGALSMKLAGGGGGTAKVVITGTYDASVSLMRVQVQVKTPQKLNYQWNDGFVPSNAHNLGIYVDRLSVAKNAKLSIKGVHLLQPPIAAVPASAVSSTDRELRNNTFSMKAKGAALFGGYNTATTEFSVSSCKANIGYGTFYTAGSLVDVSSDNFFPRNF